MLSYRRRERGDYVGVMQLEDFAFFLLYQNELSTALGQVQQEKTKLEGMDIRLWLLKLLVFTNSTIDRSQFHYQLCSNETISTVTKGLFDQWYLFNMKAGLSVLFSDIPSSRPPSLVVFMVIQLNKPAPEALKNCSHGNIVFVLFIRCRLSNLGAFPVCATM